MLKLEQRYSSEKNWAWQITGTCPYTGKPVRRGTRTRERAVAEAKLTKYIETQREAFLSGGKTGTVNFAKAVANYLMAKPNRDERFIKPLLHAFGSKELRHITDQDILEFSAKQYPGCKSATILRQVYRPLEAIWNLNAEMKLVQLRRFNKPKEEPVAVAYAENDELLLKIVAEIRLVEARVAVMFMSLTGTRVSKTCALKTYQYDPVAGTVDLGITKNGLQQMVVLTAALNYWMSTLLDLSDREALLFRIKDRFVLSGYLKRACRKLKMTKTLSPHRIGRHTFAARLLRSGASLKELQSAGNWASINSCVKYGHLELHAVHARVRSVGPEIIDLSSVQKVCNEPLQIEAKSEQIRTDLTGGSVNP